MEHDGLNLSLLLKYNITTITQSLLNITFNICLELSEALLEPKKFQRHWFVFAVDVAVQISRDAIMAFQGQVCCAGSRTFVQEDIYDEFVKRSVKELETRVIGDVLTTTCEHGPQVGDHVHCDYKC